MRATVLSFITLLFVSSLAAQTEPYTREKGWEKEIAAMLEIDLRQTPPADPVVFTGSSSVRMWTSLRRDFPRVNIMNRGFGGSHLEDLVFFFPKIVVPYNPKKIVVYSGENDIEVGQSAENVLADFKALVALRDRHLPGVPLVYISMKPSLLRWAKWPEMQRGNRLIAAYAKDRERVTFVDISPAMLGPDGRPKPEIFLEDGLHMNEKGYQLWRAVLGPHVR